MGEKERTVVVWVGTRDVVVWAPLAAVLLKIGPVGAPSTRRTEVRAMATKTERTSMNMMAE